MHKLVITIGQEYVGALGSVTEKLAGCGLKVTRVFPFGVITGEAEESAIDILRGEPEVVSLTFDKEASVGPPDADVQ